jgi:hypothetical protein
MMSRISKGNLKKWQALGGCALKGFTAPAEELLDISIDLQQVSDE